MPNPTIVVIADYGTGDPAFTEVLLKLSQLIPDAKILPQSTPPFSTVNTGFWISQLALTPDLSNVYIFSNTAPRKNDDTAQTNNKGEKLMYAKLQNGFEIIAVNAGYVFSFVKPDIADFKEVKVANEGSQFRSRDFYPKAVAQMVTGDTSYQGESQDTSMIPAPPSSVIASIDGYGNLKTSIRSSTVRFTPGQRVKVAIGSESQDGIYTDGVFNVPQGKLSFAPGSTGHSDRFMELFVRGSSAWKVFNMPKVEEAVTIIPL